MISLYHCSISEKKGQMIQKRYTDQTILLLAQTLFPCLDANVALCHNMQAP